MLGYNRMLEVIKPQLILCFDDLFSSMKRNIKSFLLTTYEWIKFLSWQELANFQMENIREI